jgi:hypothetical protein
VKGEPVEGSLRNNRWGRNPEPISDRASQLSVNSTETSRAPEHNLKRAAKMSYYFVIIGTQDNPLFEYEFGTAKQGGDGIARFPEQARHMNQFIVHSSLDIVEEVQWGNGQMYVGSATLDLHLLTVSEVSQVHRSVLQQLRLLLDDGRQ